MSNWDRNDIQFARLIAEMEATGVFNDPFIIHNLIEAMDVTGCEIMDLIERASNVWDEVKAHTTNGVYKGPLSEIYVVRRDSADGPENDCFATEAAASEWANYIDSMVEVEHMLDDDLVSLKDSWIDAHAGDGVTGNGECPSCGADIPEREMGQACAECGALPDTGDAANPVEVVPGNIKKRVFQYETVHGRTAWIAADDEATADAYALEHNWAKCGGEINVHTGDGSDECLRSAGVDIILSVSFTDR